MKYMKTPNKIDFDDGNNSLVVYGGITVDSLATLTIAPGTTIYFHDDAGIDVMGKLICKGTAEKNVTLRGDRLDDILKNKHLLKQSYQYKNLPHQNVSHMGLLNIKMHQWRKAKEPRK